MISRDSNHFDESPEDRFRMAGPHFLGEFSFGNAASLEDELADDFDDDTIEQKLPFELFLPERFEPKYRYPVVIWLHEDGRNESQLHEVMPSISDQNYIGIAFRGTSDDGRSVPGAFHWDLSDDKIHDFADEVRDTLTELSRFMRIDVNRITLAGFGGGATMALQLLLHSPETFSSAVAFGGAVPQTDGFAGRFRLFSSRRVLLGVGRNDAVCSHRELIEGARRLDLCGLNVETSVFNNGHELTREMLRSIDHWLMSACATALV